jgi:hypothetical protein
MYVFRQMHDFIAGDLKSAIRKDEKQLRKAQRRQERAPGQEQLDRKTTVTGEEPQRAGEVVAAAAQEADGRSAKRQRIEPVELLQPALGDARSRLRSKRKFIGSVGQFHAVTMVTALSWDCIIPLV